MHASMQAAVADAMRQGWQLEADGPGWAQLGKFRPVNHGAMLLLTILTAGLGLFVWAYVWSRGPQWERIIVSADVNGVVTVTPTS